ncbi:MAG: ASCH domain-containing protein [Caldilineaceae bacterium]|nr:ASCH domain-containing protein [Caldilineaceae bacterium]
MTQFKALSFRQPWAELILQGRKTMDLRTYNTHQRGRILIHAAQTVEHDVCRLHDIDPATVAAGGFVGSVMVVDVVPLTEEHYAAARDQHLGGRHFQSGMFGWILADPVRLPQLIPAVGRTNLFTVDVEIGDWRLEGGDEAPAMQGAAGHGAPKPARSSYRAVLEGTTPQRPFALEVQPATTGSTDYTLTLRQRVVERPQADPHLLTVVTLGGDNLRAVADQVLEALRRADYKVTDLTPARRKPFFLPEETGVRLGLVFLAVRPLTKHGRVEAISQGIRPMPSEEAYYWYSKCTAADTAERAQKALRILLAEE